MYRLSESQELVDAINKYLIDLRGKKYELGDVWEHGCQFTCPKDAKSGKPFNNVDKFLGHIKKKDKKFWTNLASPIDKRDIRGACFFTLDIGTESLPIYIFYDGLGIRGPIYLMSKNKSENAKYDVYPPDLRDKYILEDEHEVDLYRLTKELESVKKEVSDIKEFLADPWNDYNAKKKRYEEKLEKARTSTKYLIETRTKELKEKEEKLKELEKKLTGLFTGEDKK